AAAEERRGRGHREQAADRRAEGGHRRDPELLRSEAGGGGDPAPLEAHRDLRSGRARDAGGGVPPRPRAPHLGAGFEDRESQKVRQKAHPPAARYRPSASRKTALANQQELLSDS